jgi:signal transduction histidine kinase
MVDLDVDIASDVDGLPDDLAAQLLAITREGLSNIAKHSGATQATLELRTEDDVVRLAISDNGRGFDPTLRRSNDQHGLVNLKSRAQSAGGALTIESGSGSGTRVIAEIPVRAI